MLAGCIRSSGYYNQKAMKIKSLCEALGRFPLAKLKGTSIDEARAFLLSIRGIGPETADSILLYALETPSFVVDAYTRRIFARLGVISGNETYAEMKSVFEKQLQSDVNLFKEYHALIVRLGKDVCKKKPVCDDCPLRKGCAQKSVHISHAKYAYPA